MLLSICPRPLRAETPGAASPTIEKLQHWLSQPRETRGQLSAQPFAATPLSHDESAAARKLLWDDHVAAYRESRQQEWKDQAITIGEHTLRLKERQFGTRPKDGWSLFISMHGGGSAPPAVNDQQWENQIQLYQPKEGLYIAPRAPTDTWNLWHESHIDALFDRLLEDAFALGDVNPNRVYIMGYSAGGDGVYQLAPRMADRWAAASMMAGHPNDASPLGLRDLPFAIHVGALDDGYGRNKVALEWKKKLDDLHAVDPGGYTHEVQLHEGRAHWMNREDAVAVEWMAGFTRDPFPKKVVWKQASTTHDHFYWLAVPEKSAVAGTLAVASRDGQTITLEKTEGLGRLNILLNDRMLDMDQPVMVIAGGRQLFKAKVPRTLASLEKTLAGRGDPILTFDAEISIGLEGEKAK